MWMQGSVILEKKGEKMWQKDEEDWPLRLSEKKTWRRWWG